MGKQFITSSSYISGSSVHPDILISLSLCQVKLSHSPYMFKSTKDFHCKIVITGKYWILFALYYSNMVSLCARKCVCLCVFVYAFLSKTREKKKS